MLFLMLIMSWFWFCGNESTKTIPFKLLRITEIIVAKLRYNLFKTKYLMLGVRIAVERVEVWQTLAQRGSWDVGATIWLYKTVAPYFKYPSKLKCQNAHISWLTLYNLYMAHNKVFAMDFN